MLIHSHQTPYHCGDNIKLAIYTIYDKQAFQSRRSKMHVIYEIMKIMYPLENQWAILFTTTWLYGNPCTWAHYLRLHTLGTNETNSVQKVKQRVNIHFVVLRI